MQPDTSRGKFAASAALVRCMSSLIQSEKTPAQHKLEFLTRGCFTLTQRTRLMRGKSEAERNTTLPKLRERARARARDYFRAVEAK